MTAISALSGTGSTGPGIQQTTTIVGSSGDPSGADTSREVQLTFVNGDGDTVLATFLVNTSNETETGFVWPFDSNASLTVTVEAEEV
jgi:hypothetical protein